IMDSISMSNHKFKAITLQEDVLNFRKELAEKQGKPDFMVGFDYTFIGKGDNGLRGTDAFVFPRVGITIPLYRNKYRAMVNEVMLLKQANVSEQDNQLNILEILFEN
ncbi:MAG: hypothetical protein C0594_11210, partial [Marinilabiliales bacterium]